MAREVMQFDKSNSQEDYQYMAKNMRGNYEVGYVVVVKPWYSERNDWTYYIYSNQNILNTMRDVIATVPTLVAPDTIEPYTQIAKIKWNQSIGVDTLLVKDFLACSDNPDNRVAFIGVNDEIPYELWNF